MGGTCSSDQRTASRPVSQSGNDVDPGDARLVERAREANQQWLEQNRTGFSRFLQEAHDTESQLLVCTLASAVRSAGVDRFHPWCGIPGTGNGGSVAPSMSVSNVNYGATMLKGMISLMKAIVAEGEGSLTPNSPVSESQLMNVLRFKDTWRGLMDASAVQSFCHPYLGNVAIVQPLLMNCIVARLTGGDEEVLELVQYLLENGGHPSVPNSLGLSPLMVCVGAYILAVKSGDSDPKAAEVAVRVVRLLVDAGADTTVVAMPLGPDWRLGAHATGIFYALEPLLQRQAWQPFTALEALEHLLVSGPGDDATGGTGELASQMRSALQPRPRQQLPAPLVLSEPLPWTQVVFNIIWAVSQVAGVSGSKQRCVRLDQVRTTSPFKIPELMFCSAPQLRALGRIPRYEGKASAGTSAADQGSAAWEPTAASELPERAVTVFLSHRWLGGGCPDDAQGTKARQALQVARLIAELRGVPESLVYLWIDWSVLDQSDPMPGVKALPMYIAACDHFVYLHHEEYFERAWCLTEQYIFWKLCQGQPKHYYRDPAQGQAPKLLEQANDRKPPEPARGKLSCEAERIALAALAAIMSDTA